MAYGMGKGMGRKGGQTGTVRKPCPMGKKGKKGKK